MEEDLAVHYSFVEASYLTLVGRLPVDDEAERFEVALSFLSVTTIAEAPAHSAMLAQLCGARHSAICGTGAMALAEQARFICDQHDDLWEWHRDPAARSPALKCDPREEDENSIAQLERVLELHNLPAVPQVPGGCRLAVLLALLIDCGLTKRWQVETAMVQARLAVVAAEAHGIRSRLFRKYPMDLPSFVYVEDDEA